MTDKPPLLSDKQLEILLKCGPELDKIEPMLSPELRQVLVDLQRNAADAYAAGTWTVAATGETITVPEQPLRQASAENAQNVLGKTYLSIAQQADKSKALLKSIMDNLGLNPSAPAASAQHQGRA